MKKPTQNQLNHLADKWLKGTITAEERELFDQWYELDSAEPLLWTGADESEDQLNTRLQLNFKTLRKVNQRKVKLLWKVAAAAVLVLSLSTTWYFITLTNEPHLEVEAIASNILPGTNTAVLTLANGTKINLDSLSESELTEQSGIKITKTVDGKLLYTSNNKPDKNAESLFNTIETPRGGQYEIRLPDGTKVWLNAASKLVYPLSFSLLKVRSIQLYGEAYFEVAKTNNRSPFVVHTSRQEIVVLGTHFNVNNYDEEVEAKTTLLEGLVQVTAGGSSKDDKMILKPGEQSILSMGRLRVQKVKAADFIDWKQGYFKFDNESLTSIMRRVSRWYNVEVSYADEGLKQQRFSGTVSRFKNIAELLEKLELTGPVKFRITGKQVNVMPD